MASVVTVNNIINLLDEMAPPDLLHNSNPHPINENDLSS